jgi:hypothetical protein
MQRCEQRTSMLDVIGAGFGRTGTLSLKAALEQLGFDRCYHMYEVFQHPEDCEVWLAADRGEAVDWDTLFDGYRATVDWPACTFWRELMPAFPDAKVLLSVRPPDRWYASFRDTIRELMVRPRPPGELPPAYQTIFDFADAVVRDRSFGPGFAEMSREQLIEAYERHNASVRESVPADRLLVFDVAEGWEPLCGFLGVDIPNEPFPNINDKAQFRVLFGLDDPPRDPTNVDVAELQARFRDATPG